MKRLLALALLVAAAAFSGGVGHSQATFVANSQQAATTFAASAAFNGVAVSLSDPGTPLRGSVPLSATASSDRPLVSVTFQRSPAGAGTWTTICAPTAAPYACSWDSTAVADGLYDLRAVALDGSGYSRTSSVSSRRVDNAAPATTVTAATPLTGAATVSATATDAGSGVISVALEARPSSGGAWTSICTKGSAPYSCSWDTTAVADGAWDVRATATDAAGNTSSATTANRIVDNTAPTITLTNPGSPLGGTVTLASTTGDGAGSGVAGVLYQYRANGSTGAWSTACTGSTAPFSCSWATPATGNYELRATATDGVGKTTTTATISNRQVDNTIPATATLNAVASPLKGAVTLSGTGTDANSGMASMRFEYKPSAGSTWSTACSWPAPGPYSCSWDTTAVADGSYDVRAVAIDAAGNTRASTTTTGRVVDNTGPAVTLTSPGMFRGTATVAATATDATGITNVAIQYSVAGANTWLPICTDTSSPYSCSWNAASRTDGAYDLRAVSVDTLGNQSTSATVTAYVNNLGPTGTDVQGTNGGVNDKLDTGDTVVFTYSEAINPSSILAGWTTGTAAIRVRVNNTGGSDSMEFYDAANTTPLGLLAAGTALSINIDHVTAPTLFNGTIARSGSTVTVTIGSLISGAVTANPKGKNAMVWQTNSQATSLATGKPVLPQTITESGASDIDF
ncbi:MAG TPA: Ig-like domain-containing protein [Solirubrobacteraceae bacterium]|nr:Ig-like domain-containing protein [Solirubrobacteraceae bacterium]